MVKFRASQNLYLELIQHENLIAIKYKVSIVIVMFYVIGYIDIHTVRKDKI